MATNYIRSLLPRHCQEVVLNYRSTHVGSGEGLVALPTTNEVEVLRSPYANKVKWNHVIKKGWDFFRQL